MARGQRPLSKKGGSSKGGLGCAFAFLLLFGTFGLLFLFPVVFLPAKNVVDARDWEQAACTVLASEVESHSSDDGTTYSVEVRYRFTHDGRTYEGDRYDFYNVSSGGREGKEEVVRSMPPGSEIPCWFDPQDPERSVVQRELSWASLIGLVPLFFVLIGYGGAFLLWRFALRTKKIDRRRAGGMPPLEEGFGAGGEAGGFRADFSAEDRERGAAMDRIASLFPHESDASAKAVPGQVSYDYDPAFTAGFSGPLTLEPPLGPLGKLLGTLFICLFWNGITGVFVWLLYKEWVAGSLDGCLPFILLPFVLVGLALLLAVPYQILALFNPVPRLTLSPGTVRVGGTADLAWSFEGGTSRIRRLTLTLIGTEEATYRQGTSTSTAKNKFASRVIHEVTHAPEIASGHAQLVVPGDTMHTFKASNNKVLWRIELKGDIAWWPDVMETMEITVLPPAAES